MKRRNRPKPGRIPSGGSIPSPQSLPPAGLLVFSFKYYDQREGEKFGVHHAKERYASKLLERMKALCEWKREALCATHNRALRFHPIDFGETTEPDGFSHLSEQLWRDCAWQFEVSVNEHGRVHGFIAGDVFYVVWIDPTHKLYP